MLGYPLRAAFSFAFLFVMASSPSLLSQDAGFKDFNRFKAVVPGVDFFASNRQLVTPYEKPIAEARERLANLLGQNPPPGAIFVCSTLAQKDAVYEPRALKMGFSWILSVLTPEARADEMMARLKQSGVEIPADRLERMRSRAAENRPAMEAGLARGAARDMAFAVLQVALAPDREFRLSRVDDMGRSPLPDWLDIGIASYASGSAGNVGFLQQHLEEIFPLEDILTMSRPFVAPGSETGGGQMVFRMERPAGAAGAPATGGAPAGGDQTATPGSSGVRMGGPRTLPKDQQDRMMFDGQAASFFTFLVEKAGIEKIKEVVSTAREKKDATEVLKGIPAVGEDFDKAEEEWTSWLKTQKPDPNQEFRFRMGGERSERPPQ
ncbi:MAG: hypothetical protein EHM23_17635 [Acidobacteria bacterium]|nr:MAG: hypothetical protein EHM23_17635 [Acidobacteriota bacterium]